MQSNNPVGGLGLTCGILDAFAYGNALTRVLSHGESDELLTACAESRRQAWLNTTDPLSRENLARIRPLQPGDVESRKVFFKKLNDDPTFAKQVRGRMDAMIPESFAFGDATGLMHVLEKSVL